MVSRTIGWPYKAWSAEHLGGEAGGHGGGFGGGGVEVTGEGFEAVDLLGEGGLEGKGWES